MNYKALAIIFLLALPMLMVPLATANQPNMNVELRIRPGATKFTGPCLVSTMFPVDVYLWNDKSLSGVGVYAYDFWVYWQNDQGISLDNFVNHIPWPTGKYYLVKNETGTSVFPGYDYYHLVVTAVGNSTVDPSLELGATGVFNASLVTLNFHVDSEPFWPAAFHADFLIGGAGGGFTLPVLSTGCTIPITNIEIDNGTYDLTVGQPNIDPEASLAPPYASNITVGAIGVTETVYIHLKNIAGAYGFGFTLTYDSLWKKTDIQHVTILPAFAPPYETLSTTVTPGVITFELIKPSEKPTICSKDIAVVKIDFTSTLTPEIGLIPTDHTGYFAITDAWVNIKNKTWTGTYNFIESDAIKAAADRLVALLSPTDFGWNWIVTGLTSHSGAASDINLYGVTALGLIEAYGLTHDAAYLTAAKQVADYMISFGLASSGAFWTAGFGYSFDYRFLMEFSAVSGDPSYSTYAKAAWAWQKANQARYTDGNQMALWDRYVNFWIGPNAYDGGAWGTGDWGLATLAMGDTTWAKHMAAVIDANMTNLLAMNVATASMKDTGMGKALEFFATLGDPAYANDIEDLTTALLADQLSNGSWGYGSLPGSPQVTAYAILGLCAAGEDAAAQRGIDWLVTNQITTAPAGGWLETDNEEYSEVDSECLKALVTCNGYSGDLGNIFRAKSNADLTLDGAVDIADLAKVASKYGQASPYAALVSPPGNVDIFDIVYVAKHFGDPEW